MPIGPRLDRPSAVGDEGRPRATSLAVVSVVVVGVLVVTGYLNGQATIFTGGGLLVGLNTAGFALLNRDRLGPQVLGHLCFLPSAVLLAAIVGFSGPISGSVGVWLLVIGSLTAMFGVAAGWNDILDRETVRETLVSSGIAYVFWILGVVSLLILGAILWLVRSLLQFLVSGAGPLVGLLGVFGLAGVAVCCLYVAVRAVPAVQLSPEDRRERARARYSILKARLLRGAIGLWALFAVGVIAAATGVLAAVVAPIAPVVDLLTSFLTVVLTVVSVVALLLAVGIWAVRRAVSESDARSTRMLAAAIASVCYLFGLLLAVPAAIRFGVVGGGVLLATPFLPLVVYVVLAGVLLAFYIGAIHERAAPAALSAAGLVAVGLGGGLAGYPSLFVFGAIAAGLVAWDVGTFGLGVTAELGHVPQTRRLELYHGVFAVGVGLVGVAALTLLDATRQSVAGGFGTPVAMGIAVLGVVLLLWPLRG